MTSYFTRRQLRRPLALACLVALPALACTDTLLNVTDPDIVQGNNSASAATGLLNGTVLRLAQAVRSTKETEALIMIGGLLTDEKRFRQTIITRNTQHRRFSRPNNTFHASPSR